jgi:hypothetical protein
MKFTVLNPVFTVVGSCDDKDAATGPGQSYGPNNAGLGSCTDGNCLADSRCLTATKLSVEDAAQTANSSARATANAKAMAKSTLSVSYSWFERLLARVGLFKPQLAMQVVVTLNASVNDGPCGAGFTVFITNGPGGANPVPNWQGLYAIAQKTGDPLKLDVTRPNGLVDTIANPGQLRDWPDGPTISALEGRYDLTFEVNAVATADGRVSVRQESELVFYRP